jgi:SAM-dependent methyltransferase
MQPQFWVEAQAAEEAWWRKTGTDIRALVMEIAEVVELLSWVDDNNPPSSVLELGIGPVGIGLGSFLAAEYVVGVDPLTRLTPATGHSSFDRFLIEMQRLTEYHQGDATRPLPFPGSKFDLVVCDNVIDHTQDPMAVLREARRIVRPGGALILGVNVFSEFGLYRWRHITRRRHPASTNVLCHPHSFTANRVDSLLHASGWRAEIATKVALHSKLFGHAFRYRLRATTLTP